MRKFTKIVAVSILLIGSAATAQAGTHKSRTTAQAAPATVSIHKTLTKKIVRKAKPLPSARNVATNSTRTVLFYNPTASRSKIVRGVKTKTSTPNLFN